MKCPIPAFAVALCAMTAVAVVPPVNFKPKRTAPRFSGEFKVNLVVIAFPDTQKPDPKAVEEDLSHLKGGCSVTDYYKEFSHGRTWPVLQAYPAVYMAPQPKGYYCRYNFFNNKIGFQSRADGVERGKKLRKDALDYVKKLKGAPRGQVDYYVYCTRLNWGENGVFRHLRKAYPKPTQAQIDQGAKDHIREYGPKVPWHDPLWPMSIPQGQYPGGGYSLLHELGHVLGAPDFYHASEEYDGVGGTPALPWAYGPTGMAYCRCIYYGFVPAETYPVFDQSGEYTLDPRSAPLPGDPGAPPDTPMPVLGCFIPTAHPNYILHLEYVHGEKPPVGSEGREGLLVHLINVTFASPMMGPPDLCYTYRADDPHLKGQGAGNAYLKEGDVFDLQSNPAAILPPLIPAGVGIGDIRMANGRCTFTLTIKDTRMPPGDLKSVLRPRIALTEVDELQPTSFRAHCDILYRGEPLLTEYGFCWGTTPHPKAGDRNTFRLYHRDRYDGRILGLRPGTKYYVRAYARNSRGIDYSAEEKEVTTPKASDVNEVPALLTDRYAANFYITRHHFETGPDMYFDSANSMIALTSLAAYYRMPLGAPSKSKDVRRAAAKTDYTRVHTNPSDSRPPFRMTEYQALYGQMHALAVRAGLRCHDFGDMKKWIKNAAKELNVAPADIIPVKDPGELSAHAARIREWLLGARPVMLVRENRFIDGVTHIIYPLDIAILDGFNAAGDYHAYFPLGHDRGIPGSRKGYGTGDVTAERLFTSVERACLVFCAPKAKK